MPTMSFFLATEDSRLTEHHPHWTRPFPSSPLDGVRSGGSVSGPAITYGEYFTAIRRFIERDQFSALINAATEITERSVNPRHIGPIQIYLEKHGQYYHPARVSVEVDRVPLTFVVNVAVTAVGRAWLGKDFANIRLLNRRFPYSFLPNVFSCGKVQLPERNHSVKMFAGQWLKGYHEFHLSGQAAVNNDRVLVWRAEQGMQRLSDQARREIYRQAAQILTAYYDLETFEQVFAWHHAAGDFVVKTDGRQVELRLITVRRYSPLFDGLKGDGQVILQALLIFLLNLTVKMRLDRLDGVGGIVWASDDVVAAALDGFFDGLFLQADSDRIPAAFPELFRAYLKILTIADLSEIYHDLYERTFKQTSDSDVIGRQLDRHAVTLSEAIDHMPSHRIKPPYEV